MIHKEKYKQAAAVFAVLTLCFIWGNSLLPASASGALSDAIKNIINDVLNVAGSNETLGGDGLLRKLAHATEFALLGIELSVLAWSRWKKRLPLIMLCGLLSALTDETIQLFVEGRAGLITDVWIDCGGFVLGVIIVLCVFVFKSRRHRNLS